MAAARAFMAAHMRAAILVIVIAIAGIALLAALLATGRGESKAGATVRTATATASAAATPQPVNTPANPSETPIPGETITNVKDLVAKYGWPPNTDFARMRIPAIGVDAKVGARVVGRDAVMADPAGPADIVWYDMSIWDGLGGTPGRGHNAIFSGHVDYAYNIPYAKVAYKGLGVFAQIRLLSQGDLIDLDYNGETLRYKVVWRKQLSAGPQTDWASIWSSDVPKDSITLYTCGGTFNPQTLEYSDRVVVRAERV